MERKEKEDKKVEKKPERKKEEEVRHRVRVAGVILDGDKGVAQALRGIRGIGHQISRSLSTLIGVKSDTALGDLSEEELSKVEKTIKNLDKQLPSWMLNRQGDSITGENVHLISSDLEMATMGDITKQKKLRSYRGVRHSLGLPVRGQRTRSTFRHGTTVGVSKKKQLQAQKKERERK